MSFGPTVPLGTELQQNLRPWHVVPPACQADFLTLKVSSFWGTIALFATTLFSMWYTSLGTYLNAMLLAYLVEDKDKNKI